MKRKGERRTGKGDGRRLEIQRLQEEHGDAGSAVRSSRKCAQKVCFCTGGPFWANEPPGSYSSMGKVVETWLNCLFGVLSRPFTYYQDFGFPASLKAQEVQECLIHNSHFFPAKCWIPTCRAFINVCLESTVHDPSCSWAAFVAESKLTGLLLHWPFLSQFYN